MTLLNIRKCQNLPDLHHKHDILKNAIASSLSSLDCTQAVAFGPGAKLRIAEPDFVGSQDKVGDFPGNHRDSPSAEENIPRDPAGTKV